MVRGLPGRRSATPVEPEPEPEPVRSGAYAAGKGRPTPRRREAESARRTRARVPQSRSEAKAVRRTRMREERVRMGEAMRTGDERYLPARDKGPVKRYVRDTIDGRRNVAEYFLPFVLVVTFLGIPFAANPALQWVPNLLLLAVLLIVVADSLVTARRLRRGITERFGVASVKGNVLYGVLRSTQFRRIRQPRPQVKPGRSA